MESSLGCLLGYNMSSTQKIAGDCYDPPPQSTTTTTTTTTGLSGNQTCECTENDWEWYHFFKTDYVRVLIIIITLMLVVTLDLAELARRVA